MDSSSALSRSQQMAAALTIQARRRAAEVESQAAAARAAVLRARDAVTKAVGKMESPAADHDQDDEDKTTLRGEGGSDFRSTMESTLTDRSGQISGPTSLGAEKRDTVSPTGTATETETETVMEMETETEMEIADGDGDTKTSTTTGGVGLALRAAERAGGRPFGASLPVGVGMGAPGEPTGAKEGPVPTSSRTAMDTATTDTKANTPPTSEGRPDSGDPSSNTKTNQEKGGASASVGESSSSPGGRGAGGDRPYMTPAAALRQCQEHLTDYEQSEILDFPQIYYVGEGVKKIQGTPRNGAMNHGYDDQRGDYTIIPHDHIAYRYEVLGRLGRGSFGQVVRCLDHKIGTEVAVKIIRNKKRFHHQVSLTRTRARTLTLTVTANR